MAGGGGGGDAGGDGLLLPLLLFAGTAKLWLVLHHIGGGPAIQRRRRRRTGAGGDAPLSSSFQHHQNLTPIVSGRNASWASLLLRKESVGGDEDDDSDGSDSAASFGPNPERIETNGRGRGGSPPVRSKQRKMSGDERMRLMERISLSDAVLTREVSMDFHPKNSNWSHFENYAPSFSPHRRHGRRMESVGEETTTETEEEDEDFLWSEPPNRRTSTPGDPNDATAMMDYTDHSLRSKKYGRRNSNLDILHFNAGCLPSKLIMVRHGQSEGNIDESLYATKPDNALRLTRLGWDMARMAGRALRDQLPPGETVHFIVSPYARTVETFHGIASAWCDPEEFAHVRERSKRLKLWYTKLMEMGLTWHEDPRIREQDFGNYQDPQVIRKAKAERHKFGSFYYRFPHGESASDVFDRVSTFLDSLWRSFESGRAQNYVLIAHGISIRVFLARYFRYSIDQFHMLANPKNCEMVMLAHDGMGRLKLDGRCELELNEVENNDVASDGESENYRASSDEDGAAQRKRPTTTEVTGYKKYSRLRTLPPQWVRPRTVRMSYKDS